MQNQVLSHPELLTAGKGAGFICILTNPSYPGCIKISKINRLPGTRAAELSNTASVPSDFKLKWSRFVDDDIKDVEAIIHEKLNEYRVNTKRGFFMLPEKEAIEKVDAIISRYFSITWGGITYRKKQDVRWGIFFGSLNIPFQYITEPFKIMSGVTFMPDFWLPNQDCYFVVSKNFLHTTAGKLTAFCFAKEKGKVIFQFWDCEPGVECDLNGDMIIHAGYYMTPEGEIDGMVEWGICDQCNSRHIGHLGSSELSDGLHRNTSKNKCPGHWDDENMKLQTAYSRVQTLWGS